MWARLCVVGGRAGGWRVGVWVGELCDTAPADRLESSLTVSLDNEQCPTVSIAVYRYDGTHCLAVVDGEPVSLVPRSDTVDLTEAVRALVWSS